MVVGREKVQGEFDHNPGFGCGVGWLEAGVCGGIVDGDVIGMLT